MTLIFPLLLVFIFLAAVGFLAQEGLWSNAIRLVNVVTAALLATNYFEPVARWAEEQADTYTFFWDFIALWGLFALFMLILRGLTDVISRVKVRFLKVVDRAGGLVFAAWTGWVMVCFTTMTLHTAPLDRESFFGAFQPENKALFLGLAGPDREWLAFMQRVSRGSFCRADEGPDYRYRDELPTDKKLAVFGGDASFLLKYATRRAEFDSYRKKKLAFRVVPEERGPEKDKIVHLDKR
jgi:uncharacterized membrane protein required for colicin V production